MSEDRMIRRSKKKYSLKICWQYSAFAEIALLATCISASIALSIAAVTHSSTFHGSHSAQDFVSWKGRNGFGRPSNGSCSCSPQSGRFQPLERILRFLPQYPLACWRAWVPSVSKRGRSAGRDPPAGLGQRRTGSQVHGLRRTSEPNGAGWSGGHTRRALRRRCTCHPPHRRRLARLKSGPKKMGQTLDMRAEPAFQIAAPNQKASARLRTATPSRQSLESL